MSVLVPKVPALFRYSQPKRANHAHEEALSLTCPLAFVTAFLHFPVNAQ